MSLGEFGLIERYFQVKQPRQSLTQLGIGDDCALLNIPSDMQLAVTTDTMVENVHFFANVNPAWLGHKLLAVNLSDLAAMGATPYAVTLALTMPKIDEDWLQHFANGFFALAQQYQVDLIGGDTTSGPLTLSVQAMGLIPRGLALLRSGARVGVLIYVSGAIGDAGLGLKILQGYISPNAELPLSRFHLPQPRCRLGENLRGIASSCIDISDGLAADLGHILQKSAVGARLDWDKLPLSAEVQQYILQTGDWCLPLTAGDDYELCFTVAAHNQHLIPDNCRCIGIITAELGLQIQRFGRKQIFTGKGFEHFS